MYIEITSIVFDIVHLLKMDSINLFTLSSFLRLLTDNILTLTWEISRKVVIFFALVSYA